MPARLAGGFSAALLMLLVVAIAGCELPSTSSATVQVGTPLPPLAAEGWIGQEPSAEELKGQVVVVQCWAYWCGPCREEAPEVVENYVRYRNRGVKFIGLTPDGASDLTKIQEAIGELSMQWPHGYGAQETLSELNVTFLPTLIVVGRDGRVAWVNFTEGTLQQAIEKALAE